MLLPALASSSALAATVEAATGSLLLPTDRTPTQFVRYSGGREYRSAQGRQWRYFTIMRSGSKICAVFKNAVIESWVGGACSRDGGLTFRSTALISAS